MRHFRCHADAFAQRGGRMDGLADGNRVGAYIFAYSLLGNRLDWMHTHTSITMLLKSILA
jgi:hypothetical protein